MYPNSKKVTFEIEMSNIQSAQEILLDMLSVLGKNYGICKKYTIITIDSEGKTQTIE